MDAERLLRWLLTFIGGVLSLALIAVFLPTPWMESAHRFLGLGDFPASTLVDYLTRSIAAVYALHGGVVLLAASDPRRYLGLVYYLGGAHIVFGAIITGIDLHAGMPTLWLLSEGPPAALLGVLILVLARKLREP